MSKEKKYKSPKIRKIIVDIYGWIFLIGMLLGIWIDEYRWKLISTAIFFIFLAIIVAIVDNYQEKKFNEQG